MPPPVIAESLAEGRGSIWNESVPNIIINNAINLFF